MMNALLVATDGSEQSAKALTVAAALAKTFKSRVVVLHVLMRGASFDSVYRAFQTQKLSTAALDELVKVPSPAFGFEMSGPITPVVPLSELAQLGKSILESAKGALAREGCSDAAFLLEDGDPAERIVAVAQREKIDAIVMGHRGFGAIQELVAGSVSTKVGHRAACTVISVK